MRPYRSALFVPAHKPRWAVKALARRLRQKARYDKAVDRLAQAREQLNVNRSAN